MVPLDEAEVLHGPEASHDGDSDLLHLVWLHVKIGQRERVRVGLLHDVHAHLEGLERYNKHEHKKIGSNGCGSFSYRCQANV